MIFTEYFGHQLKSIWLLWELLISSVRQLVFWLFYDSHAFFFFLLTYFSWFVNLKSFSYISDGQNLFVFLKCFFVLFFFSLLSLTRLPQLMFQDAATIHSPIFQAFLLLDEYYWLNISNRLKKTFYICQKQNWKLRRNLQILLSFPHGTSTTIYILVFRIKEENSSNYLYKKGEIWLLSILAKDVLSLLTQCLKGQTPNRKIITPEWLDLKLLLSEYLV